MEMRVILGSEFNPTPVFHDTLKYIVFSPTWMVPNSIFANEFFPRLRENPSHYSTDRFKFYKNGVEIDPIYEPWTEDTIDATSYSVIEKPGNANSLGSVKFIMPNDFSIYLHDTPADILFDREERALSHGCVRLEYPVDLAAYLLSDQKTWNEKRINEAMEAGEPVKVDLEKPYPVYIVYRTAWVDDKGIVHFRNDIYGHDQRHLAYLQQNESLL
jgi:murein L,D-transpeptidase YcbB/YkuD